MNTTEIGARLRRLRKDKKLSQKGLADAAGLNPNTVLFLEQGALGSVQLSSVSKMAMALGVPLSELLIGDETTEAETKG